MAVDEGDYFFGRRSSSAPKKAAADLRISFARRSSRFSRSNFGDTVPLGPRQPGTAARLHFGVDHPAAQRLAVKTELLTHGGVAARRSPLALHATRAPGEPPAPATHPDTPSVFPSTPSSRHRMGPPRIPGRFSSVFVHGSCLTSVLTIASAE